MFFVRFDQKTCSTDSLASTTCVADDPNPDLRVASNQNGSIRPSLQLKWMAPPVWFVDFMVFLFRAIDSTSLELVLFGVEYIARSGRTTDVPDPDGLDLSQHRTGPGTDLTGHSARNSAQDGTSPYQAHTLQRKSFWFCLYRVIWLFSRTGCSHVHRSSNRSCLGSQVP